MITKGVMKGWTVLADGGSGSWLWARETDPGVFVFLEIIDCQEYGGDMDDLWNGSVSVVDMPSIGPEQVARAVESAGMEIDEDRYSESEMRMAVAEMCHQYGAKSPMFDSFSGKRKDEYDRPDERNPYFVRLLKRMREEAAPLLNKSKRDELLDTRIVNGIGQTAREYAQGTDSMWTALRRIAADENATPEQKLVLKMYGACNQTLGGDRIPADLKTG